GRGMLGSRRRIVEARRTETAHRWRGRSLLIGESGVALRRFSQTGRDLFPDPGALFSAKPISFQRSRIIRRQFHEGGADRPHGILPTKTSAAASLTHRAAAAKGASSCLAMSKRFKQRLGRIRGPINGV